MAEPQADSGISPELGDGLPRSPSGKKRSASDADIPHDLVVATSQDVKRAKVDGDSASVVASPAVSEPSPAEQNLAEAATKAHTGWNRGVNSGLRTSFAASSKGKPGKQPLQRVCEPPVQPSAEPSQGTETRDLGGLVMPPTDPGFMKRHHRGKSWEKRFVKWCVKFMALNEDTRLDDPDLLRAAWGSWLRPQLAEEPAVLAVGLQAAADADLNSEKLQDIILKSLELKPGVPGETPPEDKFEQTEGSVSEQRTQDDAGSASDRVPSPGGQEASPGAIQGSRGSSKDDWVLPPSQSLSDFEIRQKDQRGWEEKFIDWCKVFARMNGEKIKADMPRHRQRVMECYGKWIGAIEGLSKAKIAAARRAAFHFSQDHTPKLVAVFSSTSTHTDVPAPPTEPPPPPPPDDASPTQSAVALNGREVLSAGPLSNEDMTYREKYFPGIGPDTLFCELCACYGHRSAVCPDARCRFCQDPSHRSFSCPNRRRCSKCKQLGHLKEGCSEKLALPLEERECAFCGSRDHDDASCHELSRSFSTTPDKARKVCSLPVFCSWCGRQGHFMSDCGLNPEGARKGLEGTWSQANLARYLDPASSEVAIIDQVSSQPVAKPGTERPDLGKSIVPRRHVFFEEDDDGDDAEDFIRPPVQKSARVGQITFGGKKGDRNEGWQSKQYSDRNRKPGFTQPPLPPGPPPPLPPSQGSQQGGRWNNFHRSKGGGRGSYSALIGR
ncbi:hypothetical protein VTK26DRAFT_7484 [Humicola hyalothermophila]